MGTGRRLEVVQHVTLEELFRRYRDAEDPVAKANFQVVWLKAQGWRTGDVARCPGPAPPAPAAIT